MKSYAEKRRTLGGDSGHIRICQWRILRRLPLQAEATMATISIVRPSRLSRPTPLVRRCIEEWFGECSLCCEVNLCVHSLSEQLDYIRAVPGDTITIEGD